MKKFKDTSISEFEFLPENYDELLILSESQAIWNKLGAWWDEAVTNGDPFHKTFIYPYLKKILLPYKKANILDIGCGNGALSRHLSKKGVKILGIDCSKSLIRAANNRKRDNDEIIYKTVDITNLEQLLSLAELKYDIAICSMVIHDILTYKPLFKALNHLLVNDAKFIVTLPHPCFNSPYTKIIKEKSENPYLAVSGYAKEAIFKIKAKNAQPLPHFSFHRSLSTLFNDLIMHGFHIDEIIEPTLINKNSSELDSGWKLFNDIPPVLICVCRFIKRN